MEVTINEGNLSPSSANINDMPTAPMKWDEIFGYRYAHRATSDAPMPLSLVGTEFHKAHQFDWNWAAATTALPLNLGNGLTGVENPGLFFEELRPKQVRKKPASSSSKVVQLCIEDDVASALVIDPMLGFQTHKMNVNYEPPQQHGTYELRSIMDQFVNDQNYDKAYAQFEEGGWLTGCPEQNRRSMENHIKRYLGIFDVRAGFTIKPCYRYTQDNGRGVKIIATRNWNKGEKITFLVGCIAELSQESTQQLIIRGRNDFSIMFSTMKKCSKLCLGPASYLNHDCVPNCRWVVGGPKNMVTLECIADVSVDQELTVSYGANFFGDDNDHCECHTCEAKGMGIFQENGKNEVNEMEDMETDNRYQIKLRQRGNYKENCVKQH